jgi:hypothetical protein
MCFVYIHERYFDLGVTVRDYGAIQKLQNTIILKNDMVFILYGKFVFLRKISPNEGHLIIIVTVIIITMYQAIK